MAVYISGVCWILYLIQLEFHVREVYLLLMRRVSQGADSYMLEIEVHNKSSYIV